MYVPLFSHLKSTRVMPESPSPNRLLRNVGIFPVQTLPTACLLCALVGTFQVKSQNAHKVPLYALRLGYRLIGTTDTVLPRFVAVSGC